MQGRRARCLLTLLVLTLAVDHQTPGVRATVILRGRWSAVVDEADVISGSTHLRGLVRMLGDHQRHRAAGRRLPIDALLNVDGQLIDRLLQAVKHRTDERTDDDGGRPTLTSSDDDAQSTVVLRRLSGSPGDDMDSLSADVSDRTRLENYQDEVERIRDAIADSSWYADEEPATEDDDDRPTVGVLNPFRRQVEPASSVLSRLRRVRRAFRRAIITRKLQTHCDELLHLVNESCNSLPKATESCQSYLMCISCNSEREDVCAASHHVTSSNSSCRTSGGDVTVTCRPDAQQVLADMRLRLPVSVGACAANIQCARFHVD